MVWLHAPPLAVLVDTRRCRLREDTDPKRLAGIHSFDRAVVIGYVFDDMCFPASTELKDPGPEQKSLG
jgi:hypothetical protein